MKTSVVRIAALLLCTAMAPAISTPVWAQTTAPDAAEISGTSAEADSLSAPDGENAGSSTTTASESGTTRLNSDGTPSTSYNSKPNYYDPYGNPYSSEYRERWPEGVLISLQRDHALPPGHFVLFMSMTKSFVGCLKISNPKHGTSFKDGIMTVTLEKHTIDERDMPRYPHYECNMAPQEASAKVALSKQLLEDNAVQKIKFRINKTTETFKVKMTDQYIQLIPDTHRAPDYNRFRAMEINGVTNPLKLWLYPEGTVILTAAGAGKDSAIKEKLMEMARSKGLTPLDEVIPDHAHYRKPRDIFYFVDKQKRYNNASGELLDYIQVDAMKFGLEADEPIKKNLAVFVRKPGLYE